MTDDLGPLPPEHDREQLLRVASAEFSRAVSPAVGTDYGDIFAALAAVLCSHEETEMHDKVRNALVALRLKYDLTGGEIVYIIGRELKLTAGFCIRAERVRDE